MRREVPTRMCEVCGGEFQRHQSPRVESKAHFENRATCSRECGAIHRKHSLRLAPEERRQWRTPEQVAQDKAAHDRRQAASLARASRHRYQWTGPELEIALREDLTSGEVAEMLGRTIAAVCGARSRARHDPKWRQVVGL